MRNLFAAIVCTLLAVGCHQPDASKKGGPTPATTVPGTNATTTPGQPGPPGTRTEQPASPDTGEPVKGEK